MALFGSEINATTLLKNVTSVSTELLINAVQLEQDNNQRLSDIFIAYLFWTLNTILIPLSLRLLYYQTTGMLGFSTRRYYKSIETVLQENIHETLICAPLLIRICSEHSLQRSILYLKIVTELILRFLSIVCLVYVDINGHQTNIMYIYTLESKKHMIVNLNQPVRSLWLGLFDSNYDNWTNVRLLWIVIISGTIFQIIFTVCQLMTIFMGIMYSFNIRLKYCFQDFQAHNVNDEDDRFINSQSPVVEYSLSPIYITRSCSNSDNDDMHPFDHNYSISKPQPYPTSYPQPEPCNGII